MHLDVPIYFTTHYSPLVNECEHGDPGSTGTCTPCTGGGNESYRLGDGVRSDRDVLK